MVLLLLSLASVWAFRAALDPSHRYQRRIVSRYLGGSTVVFAAGVALLIGPAADNARSKPSRCG